MAFFRNILNPLRIFGLLVLVILLILVGVLIYMMIGEAPMPDKVNFGVTFSQVFAEELQLDWKIAYLAILDELKVKKLRLVAYWQKIESEKGKYSFDDLDWQIQEAEKRNAEVILAIGRKLPRWPECHIPSWARELSEPEQQERVMLMLNEVVRHYQGNKTIKIWQIENEPFLKGFGECPKLDKDFLEREISLVREKDLGGRPIMVTASGELSSWIQPALRADILGTTLYRIVWHKRVTYFKYPIKPVFYYKRARLVKWLTGIEKVLVAELQAEPWGPKMIYEIDLGEQLKSMNSEKFREVIEYTKRTGFNEIYLWGAEWWFWLKDLGWDNMWQEAEKVFNN